MGTPGGSGDQAHEGKGRVHCAADHRPVTIGHGTVEAIHALVVAPGDRGGRDGDRPCRATLSGRAVAVR